MKNEIHEVARRGWFMRKLFEILTWLPVYIAIVTTLTLLAVVFGLPFVPEG